MTLPDSEVKAAMVSAPPSMEFIAAERFSRWMATADVLQAVQDEREAQHAQWGDQDIPMGTSRNEFSALEHYMRQQVQDHHAAGTLTYADVLLEEVYEALAEEDPAKMVDELVQVAAGAVKMIELTKRRLATPTPAEPAGT